MVSEISTATRTEMLEAIRGRYRGASKRDKSRMLDEFVAMVGYHRKHAVRLLGQSDEPVDRKVPRSRRIYDEAVRQALIVVWEAADRICGKRLKAALPSMVESLERHGHLDLDPGVRERLFSASASTMDRLLRPVRERAGSRRRLKRRRKMGSRVPVRTFTDWNEPTPGYLEIDLVAHNGGVASGAFIHSLVVTDVCSGWTEAVPLLAREQSLLVSGLEAISGVFPVPVRGIDSDNDRRMVYRPWRLTGRCSPGSGSWPEIPRIPVRAGAYLRGAPSRCLKGERHCLTCGALPLPVRSCRPHCIQVRTFLRRAAICGPSFAVRKSLASVERQQ